MAYQSFLDHTYSALPKIKYGPVEGMGDFATEVGTRAGKVGPEISNVRRLGRTVKGLGPKRLARTLTGPVPLAVAALQPLASATARQQVQSGQYSEPGVIKAAPGSMPGRAIDVRGISNTNPFTGQVITNYKNNIQPAWNMPSNRPNVAPWVANPEDWEYTSPAGGSTPNSVPAVPLAPIETDPHGFAIVNGKRINYNDIGKGMTKGSLNVLPPEPTTPQQEGGTDLSNLLKLIQTIQPVENYANRVNALNSGNTTWDMNSLDKILAAKAGQKADEDRYAGQIGALSNLGSSQMQSDAAKYAARTRAISEDAQNAYLAPYYKAQGEKAAAEAKAAPLASLVPLIKDQDKLVLSDKDRLEQAVKILNQFGTTVPLDPSDPGYELYHNAKDTFDYLTSKRK